MRMTMSNGRRGAPLYTARVQRFRWLFVGRRAGDAAVPAYGPEALAEQVLLLLGGAWVAVRMLGQHNPAAQVAGQGPDRRDRRTGRRPNGQAGAVGSAWIAPGWPANLDPEGRARRHVERRRATCARGM